MLAVEITPEHITTALDVRRGLMRIKQLPEADRRPVTFVLHTTSEARLAQIAHEQSGRKKAHNFVYSKPLG